MLSSTFDSTEFVRPNLDRQARYGYNVVVNLNSNKVRHLTQQSSFTRLERLKLQFSSSRVKFDV